MRSETRTLKKDLVTRSGQVVPEFAAFEDLADEVSLAGRGHGDKLHSSGTHHKK